MKSASVDPALLAAPDYREFIAGLKSRIAAAQLSAARAVNSDLILLYWDIGRGIVEKQRSLGWGESVVETIAKDLRAAFPGMRGFSANNLWLMRQFHSEYSEASFLEQLVQEMKSSPLAFLQQPVAEMQTSEPTGIGTPSSILEQLVCHGGKIWP